MAMPAAAAAMGTPARVGGTRRSSARRRRALGVALSLVAHALILLVMLPPAVDPPKVVEPPPVTVQLVQAPPLFAAALAPASAPPAPPKASPKPKPPKAKPAPVKTRAARRASARPRLARRAASPLATADDPGDEVGAGVDAELSEAQLAGAASAGAGPPGGACDMARRVQAALRRDPMVRPAVARFAGKAVLVWDGDWVWMQGDDGKGLTAVRQAIMWEIASAPKACRAEPVRGLVLFSANAAPGAARLAVGAGAWRWSDLLTPHPGAGASGR
jgi:hypothetical protein